MKKIILTMTFYCFCMYYLHGQNTFTRILENPYDHIWNNYNITETDSFYVFSVSSGLFQNIKKNGIISGIMHGYPGIVGYNNYQLSFNNKFLYVNITTGGANLISLDYSKDSIQFIKFYQDYGAGSIDKGALFDYFISGAKSIQNNLDPIFLHVDSIGNLLNSYFITPYKGVVRFVHPLSSVDYLVGLNIDTLGSCIARMDSTGNIIWAKSYFRPKGCFLSSVQNADKSLTILAMADTSLPAVNNQTLLLMNVDTNGNVAWCKSFGDTSYIFLNFPLPYRFLLIIH